jgi:hypothetical protein
MKIRFVVALVGLAISFAPPAFAQQKDTADSRIAQQRDLVGDPKALDEFGVLATKQSEAFTNKDAAYEVWRLDGGKAPDVLLQFGQYRALDSPKSKDLSDSGDLPSIGAIFCVARNDWCRATFGNPSVWKRGDEILAALAKSSRADDVVMDQ